jgi:hypothetical protein
MFSCTTLRDVILADWYFANVISTTGIVQHAVLCRVTTMFYIFKPDGSNQFFAPDDDEDERFISKNGYGS